MIDSEKTTLMAQNFKKYILHRPKVTSMFSILQLFQAHSWFRYEVMGANGRRCSRMQKRDNCV